jgi:hypothetical protein
MSLGTHLHHRSAVAAAAVLALASPGLAASAGRLPTEATTTGLAARPAAPPAGPQASSPQAAPAPAPAPAQQAAPHSKPARKEPRQATARTSSVAKPKRPKAATPARTAKPVAMSRPSQPVRSRGPTGWTALDEVIGRLPSGGALSSIRWVVTSRHGHYGATDLSTATIYISPTVPTGRLGSVARHEYAHVISMRAYGGNVPAAVTAMNRSFGGPSPRGMGGVERAADCMARELGASWFTYTSCDNAAWRAQAARLLSGRPL